MKRLIVLLLAFAMCLSLCGCNNREKRAILAVEASIDAIGTVTEDSGHDILVAETMYRGLPTEEQRRQVSNYSTLVAARKAYDELLSSLPNEVWLTADNFADYFKITSHYGEMNVDTSGSRSSASLEWFIDISQVRAGTPIDVTVTLKVTPPKPWILSTQDRAYYSNIFDTPEQFSLEIPIPANGNYSNQHLFHYWNATSMPQSNCTIKIMYVSGSFKEE